MTRDSHFELVRIGIDPDAHDPLAARQRLEQRTLPETLRDFKASASRFRLDVCSMSITL